MEGDDVAKQEKILCGEKIVSVRRFMTKLKKKGSDTEKKMRQKNGQTEDKESAT